MSNMSINTANTVNTADSVNFGRRKHRNHGRKQCQNCNEQSSSPFVKMLEAGVAIGGGLFGKKMLAAPTADEVVIQMQNAENAKAYQKLSVVDGVVESLKKEGATFTDASKEALKKVGVDVPSDKSPLEYLTDLAKTDRANVEAHDRGVIAKKLSAITTYEKAEKSLSETPVEKQTGRLFEASQKLFEGMKKSIAKMFHLETDKDGKVIGEIDTKSLKASVEEQSKNLSDTLVAKKKEITEKISNIKLLDVNDEVAKAYKSIKDSKALKGYGAVAAAVIAAAAFLFPGKNNSSRKSA